MWVNCAICGRNFVDQQYITDTRTYNICDKCFKAGHRIELKSASGTTSESNESTKSTIL